MQNTTLRHAARVDAGLVSIVGAAALGLTLVFFAGFANVTHDVAHDSRHAIAFPCH
ncbi:CbtB domain-containing protein [Oceanicella actignis]|uniref:Cobalt transporter subunit CbtB n=1 Tax=Oceanicella actignis TaxID=1189325 RepID=A0A1M7SP33_9RHOB|nr:CbtB domain-containing protein [Oceanicella actignis]TYO90873.1 cobalt transporter subunit CbtB [Oceanicella actignis]SES65003.1 cobalt transporter subunit CbtB [Oceanicella actignis]SHN60188.1 cobalt transporter subunit CbtB [Oceanicella actignis]